MANSWQDLTRLIGDNEFMVERVRLIKKDIAIEGSFELPSIARLSMDDQIFVAAFLQSEGSIKETERLFGVSYPTIKARLKKITDRLEFVKIHQAPSKSEILDRLEKGEITVDQALELLR